MNRFALAVLAVSAPFAACAAGGAYEINQDCVAVGCFSGDSAGYPVTITQPGSYVLTSDLAAPGSTSVDAIQITATPVDIDLNGHTINGGATCTGTPVTTCSGSAGSHGISYTSSTRAGQLHVHNGSITGFSQDAVSLTDSADGTLLENLTVTQNYYGIEFGATAPATTRIRNSQIVRNQGVGISQFSGSSGPFILENNTIVGNGSGFHGVLLSPGSIATGNRVSNNAAVGIDCLSAVCTLNQNVFYSNAGSAAAAQYSGSAISVGSTNTNICAGKASCP